MSRWPKPVRLDPLARASGAGCARLTRSAGESWSAGIALEPGEEGLRPRGAWRSRASGERSLDPVVIVAHAERGRVGRVLAQQPGDNARRAAGGNRRPGAAAAGAAEASSGGRREIVRRIIVSPLWRAHPIRAARPRKWRFVEKALAPVDAAASFRRSSRGGSSHDRRRSHARARASPPRRHRLSRPPQGARLSRLHRGLRALLLLFDADAAGPLHGQAPAAARQCRECRWASNGFATSVYRRPRRPAARLGDLRQLCRARLSDADPRRDRRRPLARPPPHHPRRRDR